MKLVYETHFKPQKIKEPYTDVFFSPSGVKVIWQNKKEIPVYCLGPSTACEALKHFEQVYVAETLN